MGEKSREPDFAGWATKAGLVCSDGRTIMPNAFGHMNGQKVPLVWQHGHESVENVLGHVELEALPLGVYARGYFNKTAAGQSAKEMVKHGDLTMLSIFASRIKERAAQVFHGMIREVSLVLSGANPGAVIDFVNLAHSMDFDDDSIVYLSSMIMHGEKLAEPLEKETAETSKEGETVEHADGDPTLKEILDSMTPIQHGALEFVVAAALEEGKTTANTANTAEHSDDADKAGQLTHQEGSTEVTHNVFEKNGAAGTTQGATLSHADFTAIVETAKLPGQTLKSAMKAYVAQSPTLAHGVDSLETLFPEAKTLNNTPEWNKRRTEWVSGVLNGVRRSPFSRVKSIVADITAEAARAKGYVTGAYKKEEWFGLTHRITTPTTVYKKQKFDRDDLLDISDFDTVPWVKGEMRLMLEEELAGAILIGDGRDSEDEDKIKDPGSSTEGAGIRAIVNENELYATTVNVKIDTANLNTTYVALVETILRNRRHYKGTGTPTLYTTEQVIVEMLLTKDTQNRRLWANKAELAAALMVADIVAVEIMEDRAPDVVGIIVNLADYNIGADRGGEVNLFDDFDIDYNQYKYLIETRISGALVKIKSALVLKRTATTNTEITSATEPTFNTTTGVVTIPTQANVVYKNADTSATLTAGAQTALAVGATLNVVATPATGYYFTNTVVDGPWSFYRRS